MDEAFFDAMTGFARSEEANLWPAVAILYLMKREETNLCQLDQAQSFHSLQGL